MDVRHMADWQRRFRDAPVIWVTMYRDPDGLEEIGHLYDSREAAQCEVDWYVARKMGRRPPRITSLNIHTLALAQERWTTAPRTEPADA